MIFCSSALRNASQPSTPLGSSTARRKMMRLLRIRDRQYRRDRAYGVSPRCGDCQRIVTNEDRTNRSTRKRASSRARAFQIPTTYQMKFVALLLVSAWTTVSIVQCVAAAATPPVAGLDASAQPPPPEPPEPPKPPPPPK